MEKFLRKRNELTINLCTFKDLRRIFKMSFGRQFSYREGGGHIKICLPTSLEILVRTESKPIIFLWLKTYIKN
jgi:hypothetical protein